jgi:hypothetical protein
MGTAQKRVKVRDIMTIDNEQELRLAYENITRMYRLCDRIEADSTGDPETRAAEVDGVKAMIRKIERQIAAYFATHPEKAA